MVYLPHAAEAARLSQSVRIRIFLNFSINVNICQAAKAAKPSQSVRIETEFKTIYQPFNID